MFISLRSCGEGGEISSLSTNFNFAVKVMCCVSCISFQQV
jgi:hypothetical protein